MTTHQKNLEYYRSRFFLDPNGSNAETMLASATELLSGLLAVYTGQRFLIDLTADGNTLQTRIRGASSIAERTALMQQIGGVAIPEEGQSLEALVNVLQLYGATAMRFDHRSLGQMHPNNNIPSFLGAVAAKFFNENNIVSEVSPLSTLIERQVIGWLASQAGFQPDYDGVLVTYPTLNSTSPFAGGNVTTGGTTANIAALLVARNRAYADVRETGMRQDGITLQRGVVLGSEYVHYSIPKLCDFAGIGRTNFRRVQTVQGRVDARDTRPGALLGQLDRAAASDERVIAVVAVAGTTELGAIDDIAGIAEELDKFERAQGYRPHLHVDAAHGGGFLLHDAYAPNARGKLAGIERADSVTIDPHKMLYTHYNAGCVLFRNREHQSLLKQEAGYLFKGERNQGEFRVEGSLGVDGALQTFASISTLGRHGYQVIQDHALGLTRYLRDRVAEDPALELINPEPETNVLCFRAIDEGLSPTSLNALNKRAQQILCTRGNAYISNDELKLDPRGIATGQIDVFRSVLMHPYTTEADVDVALDDVKASIELAYRALRREVAVW
jgi:glutamate decarboxylase